VEEAREKPKILLVDDSALVRRAVRTVLEESDVAEVLEVDGGATALKALASDGVDLVICDLEMPGIGGQKLLQIVRGGQQHRNTPFIMLTSREDVETKVRIFEAGANDYLTKPFHDAELLARLKVHLQLKLAQDELAEKNRSLKRIAQTDGLTQVANRRHFETVVKREMARAQRYKNDLTLMILDVDHFKNVNDQYGHVAGDEVLREVARRISLGIRTCDLVARYGGEEFCLLLPQTDLQGGLTVAERYRASLEARPVVTDDGDISITASFGVAAFPSPSVHTTSEFVRLADGALYRSKDTGRNRVTAASVHGWTGDEEPANDTGRAGAESADVG